MIDICDRLLQEEADTLDAAHICIKSFGANVKITDPTEFDSCQRELSTLQQHGHLITNAAHEVIDIGDNHRNGQASPRTLAKRYGINQKTVAKWKKRKIFRCCA